MHWTYFRHDRIRALVARCREQAEYRRRQSCDLPAHSPARGRLMARRCVVRRRLARLPAEGRRERPAAPAPA